MRGLGTIINIILIVLAGTFGCSFSSKMKEKMQDEVNPKSWTTTQEVHFYYEIYI